MLRHLLLLRHGKSDWSADFRADRERPLAPRGVKAAKRMGRFLTAIERMPDVVVSSPATRARTTAELAAEAGDWECGIEIQEDLYGAGSRAVVEVVRQLGTRGETVLIAGHEPVWSDLVGRLSGGSHVRFPTAALACLSLQAPSWMDLDWGRATLQWLVTPRLLRRVGLD
jgi:phosphohistidine phosphatase